MKSDATCLFAGNAGMLVVMAFHPSRLVPGPLIAVHVLAIATIPLMLTGAVALSRRTGVQLALLVYAVAAACGLFGAVLSLALPIVDPSAFQPLALVVRVCGQVIGAAASVAIVLWSLKAPRWLGVAGFAVAALAIAALSTMRMNAHGFGIVIGLQALWFFAAAAWLWRE